MAITIVFKNGEAEIKGDGKENLRHNEHEIIRVFTSIIGGKVIEEKPIHFNEQALAATILQK